MRPRKILFFAMLLPVLAGCNSIGSRIREKQDVFDRLDPQAQDKIRRGIVSIGYTPDMVYIALGPPGAKQQNATPQGDETTWIYKSYYERYEGMKTVGIQRIMIYNFKTANYSVFEEPAITPVYSEQEMDKIRVHFLNGKVSAIDKLRG